MERLKFRAWDSWWGKMYYFDFTKNIEATPDDELKGLWILHEEGSVYAIQDKIKIMQYTGLKDKNGKEIYEGDVCNCREYECFGKIEWNEDNAGFYFYVVEGGGFDEERLYEYADELEVIGNIYDNPELLEVSCE